MIVRLLPPLFPVILFASTMGHGSDEHASARYYVLGILLVVVVTAAVVGLAWLGRRLSRAYVRPTPRWLYLLFTLCYLGTAATLYFPATEHPAGPHGQDWLQMTAGLMSVTCAVAALVMLRRTTAGGEFRRVFYLFVPQWLQSPAEALGGPAVLAGGTGWAAQPRPIRRGLPATSSRRQPYEPAWDRARRD